MRILLDECLPKDLARELPGHDVFTVPQAGWASIPNGKLLFAAAGLRFNVRVWPASSCGRSAGAGAIRGL